MGVRAWHLCPQGAPKHTPAERGALHPWEAWPTPLCPNSSCPSTRSSPARPLHWVPRSTSALQGRPATQAGAGKVQSLPGRGPQLLVGGLEPLGSGGLLLHCPRGRPPGPFLGCSLPSPLLPCRHPQGGHHTHGGRAAGRAPHRRTSALTPRGLLLLCGVPTLPVYDVRGGRREDRPGCGCAGVTSTGGSPRDLGPAHRVSSTLARSSSSCAQRQPLQPSGHHGCPGPQRHGPAPRSSPSSPAAFRP